MYDYTRIKPSNTSTQSLVSSYLTKIPFDHATLEDRQSISCQFNVCFPQTQKNEARKFPLYLLNAAFNPVL